MKPEIQAKFATYPAEAQKQLEAVRCFILTIAKECNLAAVAETLKWGEASYQVKGGTAIRMDWKPTDPDVIKIYVYCQTRLIRTFREIYRDEFEYEGNRAIVVPLHADIKQGPLGHCLQMALKYHSLKHQPLLGA